MHEPSWITRPGAFAEAVGVVALGVILGLAAAGALRRIGCGSLADPSQASTPGPGIGFNAGRP